MDDDTISRKAAIDALCEDLCGGHEGCKFYPCDNLHPIQKLPSAERHGRWVVKHGVLAGDGIYGDMGECSVCGLHLRNYEWDYCPNCGSLMDLDGDIE